MKNKHLPLSKTLIFTMLIGVVVASACSGTKSASSASSGSASLEYRMSAPAGYSYQHTTITDQYMDIQGQSVEVSAKTIMEFKAQNINKIADGVNFDVIIDTAGMSVASMMENSVSDMNLKGKSFKMSIKPNGKPISYGEAANIEFGTASSGMSDLASMFAGIFPLLSKSQAKPGDVWTSTDTLTVKSKTNETVTIGTANYTLVGFETLNGRNCAHITSVMEGTRSSKMNSQGMDLIMSFPYKGTESIWFDATEGVIVKYDVEAKGDGIVEIVGMGMTIPVSMTTKSLLELIH
jgi:hypothetical protein